MKKITTNTFYKKQEKYNISNYDPHRLNDEEKFRLYHATLEPFSSDVEEIEKDFDEEGVYNSTKRSELLRRMGNYFLELANKSSNNEEFQPNSSIAKKFYEKALAHDPFNSYARSNLGDLYFSRGCYYQRRFQSKHDESAVNDRQLANISYKNALKNYDQPPSSMNFMPYALCLIRLNKDRISFAEGVNSLKTALLSYQRLLSKLLKKKSEYVNELDIVQNKLSEIMSHYFRLIQYFTTKKTYEETKQYFTNIDKMIFNFIKNYLSILVVFPNLGDVGDAKFLHVILEDLSSRPQDPPLDLESQKTLVNKFIDKEEQFKKKSKEKPTEFNPKIVNNRSKQKVEKEITKQKKEKEKKLTEFIKGEYDSIQTKKIQKLNRERIDEQENSNNDEILENNEEGDIFSYNDTIEAFEQIIKGIKNNKSNNSPTSGETKKLIFLFANFIYKAEQDFGKNLKDKGFTKQIVLEKLSLLTELFNDDPSQLKVVTNFFEKMPEQLKQSFEQQSPYVYNYICEIVKGIDKGMQSKSENDFDKTNQIIEFYSNSQKKEEEEENDAYQDYLKFLLYLEKMSPQNNVIEDLQNPKNILKALATIDELKKKEIFYNPEKIKKFIIKNPVTLFFSDPKIKETQNNKNDKKENNINLKLNTFGE